MDIYGKITEMTSDEIKNIDSNQIEYISLSSGDIIYIKKKESQQNAEGEKLNQVEEQINEENNEINEQNELQSEKGKDSSLIKDNEEIIEENEEENKEEVINEVIKEKVKEDLNEIKEEIKNEIRENPDEEVKVEIDVEVKKDENKEGNYIVNEEIKLENLNNSEEIPKNVPLQKRKYETIEQMKKRIREEAIERGKRKKELLNSLYLGQSYEKKKQLNTKINAQTRQYNPNLYYNYNKQKNLKTNSRQLFKNNKYPPQQIEYPVYQEQIFNYQPQPEYYEQPIYEEQLYYEQMPNSQFTDYNIYEDQNQYYNQNFSFQPYYVEKYQSPYMENDQIYYQTYQQKRKTNNQNRILYFYYKPLFKRLNPNDYYNRRKNKYQYRTFQSNHHKMEKIIEEPKEENAPFSSRTSKINNKSADKKGNTELKENNNEKGKVQDNENDKIEENDKEKANEDVKEEINTNEKQ